MNSRIAAFTFTALFGFSLQSESSAKEVDACVDGSLANPFGSLPKAVDAVRG